MRNIKSVENDFPKRLYDFIKEGKSIKEFEAYEAELAAEKEKIEKKLAERDARVEERKKLN